MCLLCLSAGHDHWSARLSVTWWLAYCVWVLSVVCFSWTWSLVCSALRHLMTCVLCVRLQEFTCDASHLGRQTCCHSIACHVTVITTSWVFSAPSSSTIRSVFCLTYLHFLWPSVVTKFTDILLCRAETQCIVFILHFDCHQHSVLSMQCYCGTTNQHTLSVIVCILV